MTVTLPRAAEWHELALHAAAQPGLALLAPLGAATRPIRRVPKFGWVVSDPELAREIHRDSEHFSIAADGASGHWWSQMLGEFGAERFEGPEHQRLRAGLGDLFSRPASEHLVEDATGAQLERLRIDLAAGRTVDIAEFGRVFTTRTMVDVTGLPHETGTDTPYLDLFAAMERLADLGKGNWATTVVPPRNRRKGNELAALIGANVEHVYDSADSGTVIGRCRDIGLTLEQTRGFTVLLVVAGTVTLASTLGRLVALLHDTGAQHRLLADASRIPDAVREGLRVTSSMPVVGRGVVGDVELGGRRLRAGDRVKVMTWYIGNSVGRFDLDLGYVPQTRQLWFGGGKHFCLGAALTHVQLTRFLETLLVAGHPWEITRRRYRFNAFVPLYRRLDIRLR
ncbi:cytochrome P450 [Nocardia lijiangensis]|uniref:cytochrome P450 n=1 Tax=Nocardia lijiangensis TaxID=299618 RepID=UPI003D727FFC